MYIKMKHRIAFMVMVVAMMIVTFAVCTSAASDKFEMSVGSFDSTGASMEDGALVKNNDEITVTVRIDKNPGIIAMMVKLKYDPTVLQLVSKTPVFEKEYTTTDDATVDYSFDTGVITYFLNPLFEEIDEVGDVFSFKFKVANSSNETIDAAISLAIADGFLIDNDMNDVDYRLTNTSVKLHNKHTEKVNDAIPATCYSEGWTKEVVCADCGEVLEAKTSTGFLQHNLVETTPAKPATCTAAGTTKGEKCTNTGCTYVVEPKEDPIKAHNLVNVDAKNPTCTEMGWSAYIKCENAGCTYKEGYSEKAPLNHVGMITDIPGKEPTATEPGLTAGKQCYNCQTWIQPQTEIPATGEASFPWVVVIIIVAVVAVAAVVVVYFTVIKKKNYKDDMFDDDDDDEE